MASLSNDVVTVCTSRALRLGAEAPEGGGRLRDGLIKAVSLHYCRRASGLIATLSADPRPDESPACPPRPYCPGLGGLGASRM